MIDRQRVLEKLSRAEYHSDEALEEVERFGQHTLIGPETTAIESLSGEEEGVSSLRKQLLADALHRLPQIASCHAGLLESLNIWREMNEKDDRSLHAQGAYEELAGVIARLEEALVYERFEQISL